MRLRWGAGRAGKVCALLLSVALFGELTISELCERTGRRRDNVRRSLQKLEARGLVECSGETVRLVADFRDALRTELEVTGILRSERLQRERHEREREGYECVLRERRREQARSRVSGLISELERVEIAESPGPIPEPVREPQHAPERGIVQPIGKSAPKAPITDTSGDTWITDANDPEQLRELASVLRTGATSADNRSALVRAQRDMRNARRARRRLDRERGATSATATGRGCRRRLSSAPSFAGSPAWNTPRCSGAGKPSGARKKPSKGPSPPVPTASSGSLWTSTAHTSIWSSPRPSGGRRENEQNGEPRSVEPRCFWVREYGFRKTTPCKALKQDYFAVAGDTPERKDMLTPWSAPA